MWISTDTLQEPRARKGSDSRFRHSVSLFSWPLASGAAFMDVIINHADKGPLGFSFYAADGAAASTSDAILEPISMALFPWLLQYPWKPYFDSYAVPMARNNFVCLLRSVCLYNLCASPTTRPTGQIRTPSIGNGRMDGNWAVLDTKANEKYMVNKKIIEGRGREDQRSWD